MPERAIERREPIVVPEVRIGAVIEQSLDCLHDAPAEAPPIKSRRRVG
jgi:hypothetical protein